MARPPGRALLDDRAVPGPRRRRPERTEGVAGAALRVVARTRRATPSRETRCSSGIARSRCRASPRGDACSARSARRREARRGDDAAALAHARERHAAPRALPSRSAALAADRRRDRRDPRRDRSARPTDRCTSRSSASAETLAPAPAYLTQGAARSRRAAVVALRLRVRAVGTVDDRLGRAPARRERRRHHDPQRGSRSASCATVSVSRTCGPCWRAATRLSRRMPLPPHRATLKAAIEEALRDAVRLRRVDRAGHARRSSQRAIDGLPVRRGATRAPAVGGVLRRTTRSWTSWPQPRHPSTTRADPGRERRRRGRIGTRRRGARPTPRSRSCSRARPTARRRRIAICARCRRSSRSDSRCVPVNWGHVRPLQVGDDEAQEGDHRLPPCQVVRQAHQEHRSRRQDGRRRPRGQPDAVRRRPEGEEDLGPQRQHRPRRQARRRDSPASPSTTRRSCTRATDRTASRC